jgi:predicted translin family RNA/ssDNA-binding protein
MKWIYIAVVLIAWAIGEFASYKDRLDLTLIALIGGVTWIIGELRMVKESLKRIEGKIRHETK